MRTEKTHSFHGTNGTSYVMWMHVDNVNNTLGLAGVALSAHPNGPFDFLRSLYPAAPVEAPAKLPVRETHDHTVLVDEKTKAAYFVKTFYKDINIR